MAKIKGIYAVMITPFNESGEVDYKGLRANSEWLIGQGIDGLLPLGSTGEFAALEDDEKQKIAETVIDAARGRVPVVVGATAETTEKAIEYTRKAKETGAAGVMTLPSYYCKPNQEEMYVHFTRIADAVDVPIIVYNNPWSSGVDVQAETFARMVAHNANLGYIKECTADIKRLRDIRILCGDKATLFCGWEELAFESFVMGAKGWVSVCANIVPRHAMKLFHLVAEKKDLAAGWELYKAMLPLLKHLEDSGKLQQTLKYSLDKMGLAGGYTKSPRLPLTDEDKAKIDGMLKALSLI